MIKYISIHKVCKIHIVTKISCLARRTIVLTNVVTNQQRKNNTVIFVENSLFVSGIQTILEINHLHAQKINVDEQWYKQDQYQSLLISQVPSDELEKKVQKLMLIDPSTNIIIIKNSIEFEEIERFVHIGIKGISLSDVDEKYLVHIVKRVQEGHIMIDSRFTTEFFNKYRHFKQLSAKFNPPDETYLKELLTKRELEILHLLVKGYSNIQIGENLFISNKTVKNHVANVLQKLEVNDRLNAVLKVLKNNWIGLK
jgi:two-component system, NarL family, response regulator DegU